MFVRVQWSYNIIIVNVHVVIFLTVQYGFSNVYLHHYLYVLFNSTVALYYLSKHTINFLLKNNTQTYWRITDTNIIDPTQTDIN